MSTIVVVRKNNQVTIGADTLTKFSQYTKKSVEYLTGSSKIIKLGNSYLAIVGDPTWELILPEYFDQLEEKPLLDSRAAIFRFITKLHSTLKETYFLNPTEDEEAPFESSQLTCLLANETGIYGINTLRWVQEYTKFWSFGSGYEYALGAMKAVYASELGAEEIAKIGLEAATEFDDSTGLPLELVTIDLQ